MKTAILISGHMRSFDRCLPTLHWHVFRHFPDADFFVSTVADDDAPKAQVLRTQYPKARVEIECVPEQPDCMAELRGRGCQLPEWWSKGSPYMHEPYAISVSPKAVTRQIWQLERCWKLFAGAQTTVRNDGIVDGYHTIIRCRPDLWFHSLDEPNYKPGIPPSLWSIPEKSDAHTPWWGRFGGVNDRFAILGATAAHAYFNTYARIPELLSAGAPLHPESLVKASLRLGGARIVDLLDSMFSTCRTNGELREPEISAADIAHFRARKAA